MTTGRSRAWMVLGLFGESLREVAVLVAVFAPLDLFTQGRPLTSRFVASTIAGVAIVMAVGIALEVRSTWIR